MDASRRSLLLLAVGASLAPARAVLAQAARPATPACGGPTTAQTEGPYFKPGSPERASLLEAGLRGRPIVVTGVVLGTDCRPVPHARLDFWQADDAGRYDNAGYHLRGHQLTDDQGRYRLETIVPGLYPGRTRHIHVKAQAPGRAALTTQMYFPGEGANARDGIFDPALLVALAADGGARFDFVLETGPRRTRGA